MDKTDLENKIREQQDYIKKVNIENTFLLTQHKELRQMAEKSGSEVAVWKHKYLCLLEERNRKV